ncbi:MAG: hypothetical protein ACR2FN_13655 [Chitinophagaceae bacterium]
MKKHLFRLAILLVFTALAIFNIQIKNWLTPEKPVSKFINLSVYKSSDYKSSAYNEALAQVHVIITKVRDNNRIIVWNKTFDALQLKQYPSIQNALSQKIIINNILDSKEHLEITYKIIYNSKGNLLKLQNEILVLKKTSGRNLIFQYKIFFKL